MAEVDKTIYRRPEELLQQLIRFNTTNPPGNEKECVHYIRRLIESAGIETHLFAKDPERPNLVARLKSKKVNSDAPALLLYGHVDVVQAVEKDWKYPPFEGKIVDGYVWGRGALDMKGAVAMMISAFIKAKTEDIDLPGDIVLCVLSDEEELGEFGARFMVEEQAGHSECFKGVKYALGEFGGFTLYAAGKKFYPIQVAEKQKCGLKAIIRGPGGHGSGHMQGGAMAKAAAFLDSLDKKLLPVHVTPAAEKMFSAMASVLPFPKGFMLRQLLNPKRTDFVLKRLGDIAAAFTPMFRHTVNATIIKGGSKINVIPREVEIQMDVRILPGFGPDDVIKELRPIVGPDVELEVLFYDPMPADIDLQLFDTLAQILKEADPEGIPIPLLLTGCTDGRFFSRLGIPTYGFTPMQLPPGLNFNRTVHGPDERIPVDAMHFGTKAIFKALQRFA